jgi:hypothetical protein
VTVRSGNKQIPMDDVGEATTTSLRPVEVNS